MSEKSEPRRRLSVVDFRDVVHARGRGPFAGNPGKNGGKWTVCETAARTVMFREDKLRYSRKPVSCLTCLALGDEVSW